MWVPALLALLLCAVSFSLCSESPRYHFVDQSLTWSEAQQFCRQHYSDLACVSSSGDNLRLPRPPGYSAPVWIGLNHDPKDLSQWKWTATNSSGSFQSWHSGQPFYIHVPQQCAHIYGSIWRIADCSSMRRAVCYSGSSPKVFRLTPVALSWADALTYCRTHHTDLALIESAEENTAANGVVGDYTWIGLFRSTAWKWSDNRAVAFTAWNYDSKVFHQPFCAAQNMQNTWEVFSCEERRPFYCQEELKTYTFVEMKFSGLGLDDSVMNQQILDEIQKRFEAAGHTDVKMKWTTAPEKQREEQIRKQA